MQKGVAGLHNAISQSVYFKSAFGFLTGFSAVLMLTIGLLGVYAMRAGEVSLEAVYTQRLIPTGQVGRRIDLMQENRSQLTFALQHEPGSKTASWYDHAVTLHTGLVEQNMAEINQIWRQYS